MITFELCRRAAASVQQRIQARISHQRVYHAATIADGVFRCTSRSWCWWRSRWWWWRGWLGESSALPTQRFTVWAMAAGTCGDPWRELRTDTRVTSLILCRDGVGDRDVLQLSRTDDGIGLLRRYGLSDTAACGMHAAIRGPTLLTPEDSQRGFALIPVLRAGAGRAHAILSRRRMRSFEDCGTEVALHLDGFPVVSGWDASPEGLYSCPSR